MICNLYPFESVSQKKGVTFSQAIESIDVGGPTMIRAAAKNFQNVLVVVDPCDYETVNKNFSLNSNSEAFRKKMAAKAFVHLSYYDSLIAHYLGNSKISNSFILSIRTAL